MEYRKLEYFLKVCEFGSISRAAQKLYISQQALSKNIDSLENELGVPLFYRTPQGIALTRYGEALREEGQALITRQENMLSRIAAMREEHEQTVSISFYSGMITQYPAGFFENFITRHKDTHFRFYCYADNEHGRRYANMNVDLFFSNNPLAQTDMTLLYEIHLPLHAIMSKTHPLAKKEILSLEDLRGSHMLTINSDFDAQSHVRAMFEQAGITIVSELSDAEQEFSYSLLRTCGAIMFFAGPDELLPEGVVRRPLADESFLWHSYIYGRAGKLPRAARDLIAEIREFRDR